MAFQYTPLREGCIRLLQVLPPGPRGEPQLNLINNVTIEQKGLKYTALSYCWGNSNDTVPAIVDGVIFNITRNLHQALASIVSHHQSITGTIVWIDAICINQDNAEEKSRQVSQMWRTFGSARRVLAWLGPEDGTSEAMFEALDQVRRHMRRAQRRPTTSAAGANMTCDNSRSIDISKCIKRCGALVVNERRSKNGPSTPGQKLLTREYFSRVWVIMECVQAVELTFACGRYSCTYEELIFYIDASSRMQSPRSRRHSMRSALPLLARRAWSNSMDHGLRTRRSLQHMSKCLRYHAGAKCTDPRDRVFAMLGHPYIRDLCQKESLEVDYSLSCDELYIITLAWLNDVCKSSSRGCNPELYAKEYANILRRALRVKSAKNFLDFVYGHTDWKFTRVRTLLVLPNRMEIDCHGPILGTLIRVSQIKKRKRPRIKSIEVSDD